MAFLSPFAYSDYQRYLRDLADSPEATRGMISRLAAAAGCQRSYLSRAISGHVQLTEDHAFGIAKFLGLSKSETECFLFLVEIARASSSAYRAHLLGKLAALKKHEEDLSKKMSRASLASDEGAMAYYSAWFWSAIHIAVSIPDLQTEEALAERLHLPPFLVQEVLARLSEMGLVKKHGNRWTFASSELHVNRYSPLVSMHHMNWRQRATLDAQATNEESVHFTVIQSMTPTTFERIKKRLLDFIAEASAEAGPSAPEELVCLTCDFFKT